MYRSAQYAHTCMRQLKSVSTEHIFAWEKIVVSKLVAAVVDEIQDVR